MAILSQITEDLERALKAREETKVSTLRFLISKFNNAKIAKGSELSDEEVLSEIAKEAKRHKESIAAFESGGRKELAEKESAELEVLNTYLPEQMPVEEIAKIVDETISELGASGVQDMGKVMSAVMSKVKGSADGGQVSQIVKEKLG